MPYDLATAELLAEKMDKVTVVYTPEGSTVAIEIEGQLQAAAPMGIMLRRRANEQSAMIEAHQIESITQLSTSKPLSQKLLKTALLDDARFHLADRHGQTLSSANAMTNVLALQAHIQIDHTDLGHNHSK